MATDEEITKMWKSFSEKGKQEEAAIRLYRQAEQAGQREAIRAMEKELVTDATIESAIKVFGWGRKMKESTITLRAIIGEASRIAKAKVAGKNL